MITRFAPSPTGYLHLGNVRTALFNWLMAKQAGGTMQLRLEDTDRARSREEYAAALVEDLHWLGLDFSGDAHGQPWRQSQRLAIYEEQLAHLRRGGEHCYPCFCSEEALAAERKAQLAAGKPPRYSGKCAQLSTADAQRRIDGGEAAVWRFRVPRGEKLQVADWVRGDTTYTTDDLGDFILRRASNSTNGGEGNGGNGSDFSFLFVNAVDDALLGVTDVLRGEDHTTNTPRQLLLLRALQLPAPRYGHIALMVGAGGKPLSKRDGLAPVAEWRERGYLPAALINYLARVGHTYRDGQCDALSSLDELAAHFSCNALGRAPAQYDDAQLHRWQKDAVMMLSPEDYRSWLGDERLSNLSDVEGFCALTRENITLPHESDAWQRIISEDSLSALSEDAAAAIQTAAAASDGLFAAAAEAADSNDWKEFCDKVGKQSGKKGKALFLPLRAALTGRTDGPAMQEVYAMLSVSQRRQRLSAAAN